MSLADRAAALLADRQGGSTCPVCTHLAQMDEADREAMAALADTKDHKGNFPVSQRELAQFFTAEGYELSRYAAGVHRAHD